MATLWAQERFDYAVHTDFFGGLSGDRAAPDRTMKKCEEILAVNPLLAKAMVWHG